MFEIKSLEEFVGNDGETYQLEPLDLDTLTKFANWARFGPYRDVIEAGISEEKADGIFQECIEKSRESVGLDEVLDSLTKFANLKKLVELGCPELEGKNLIKVIGLDNLGTVQRNLLEISGIFSSSQEMDEAEENPTK